MNTLRTPGFSGFIPMALWGKDHNSTVAYAETVMVDCGGFEVGCDARMRSSANELTALSNECPYPKRPGGKRSAHLAVAMRPEHGTRLNDGRTVDGHDDWACLRDAAHEGLFTVGTQGVEPGAVLHLSEKGVAFCNALRAHKASGQMFGTFRFDALTAA